jgi:quercetin dioxygenase-like cupin family protein
MHSHPTLIAYYFEAASVKHTFPNGETKVQDIPAGKLIWKPDGLTHAIEIVGTSDQHVLVIELKK